MSAYVEDAEMDMIMVYKLVWGKSEYFIENGLPSISVYQQETIQAI